MSAVELDLGQMVIHHVIQGSPEWLEMRTEYFSASEAPVMMGASPSMSRDDLLQYKTTKEAKEVDRWTQKIFNDGHETEANARPISEKKLGEELFPVTASRVIADADCTMDFSASLDGLTMLYDISWEHKQWNKEKAERYEITQDLDPLHYWQLEHQLLVTGAEKALFTMSDGTPDKRIDIYYESVPLRRMQLFAGWKQFAEDLKDYTPIIHAPKPEAAVIKELPSLDIRVQGHITQSNMREYKDKAIAFIKGINTKLVEDQDFADAEETVKFCKKSEQTLELVKNQILEQTADISKIFRSIDEISEAMRRKRLDLDKLVKSEKAARKQGIIDDVIKKYREHVVAKQELLGFNIPDGLPVDFYGVCKGKKALQSMQEAVNDELARAKIAVNETCDMMSENKALIDDVAEEYKSLFPDTQALLLKNKDDLENLILLRISEEIKARELREQQEPEAKEAVVETKVIAGLPDATPSKMKSNPVTTAKMISDMIAPDKLYVSIDWDKLEEWRKRNRVSKKAFKELQGTIENQLN